MQKTYSNSAKIIPQKVTVRPGGGSLTIVPPLNMPVAVSDLFVVTAIGIVMMMIDS